MAEKKRKGAYLNVAPTSKKTKTSAKAAAEVKTPADPVVAPVPSMPTTDSGASKRTRKRAVDFLYEEPEQDAPKLKKDKKSSQPRKQDKSLTVDGANGVVEKSEDEDITITTAKKPKKKSMMAEAERTQDAELAEEYGSEDDSDSIGEEIDAAPALLTGFDSDNDDPAEDKDFDSSRVGPIPQFKKTSKKLRKAKESKNDGPGVVYIGRIPHGFYESQMHEYFTQFGEISRLRLSRNKKTGASKHFAFIEFTNNEVAKVAAETMDNYLMFGHILKCKYAPAESLHVDVWKGANKKYRKIPQHKLLKQKAEQPKTETQIEKKMSKVQRKREEKQKHLKELGYDYDLPTLVKPSSNGAIENTKEKELAIEEKVEGALVPPPTVPKDELAVKVEEEKKKQKKSKNKKSEEKIVEEIPVAVEVEKPVSKKSKKAKDVTIAKSPVVIEEIAVVTEEAPKKSKKKGEGSVSAKVDKKEPKSILKKPRKV